jgi:putative DNA primase/helicase
MTGYGGGSRLIPFERQFGPGERDENLRSKLLGELPGIVNWLVQGCLLWQREGLIAPETVRAAVDEYRSDEDVLRDFIAEHIVSDPFATIRHSEVFERYQNWARGEGISFALSSKGLSKRLRERGFREGKDSQGNRTWRGLSLKGDALPATLRPFRRQFLAPVGMMLSSASPAFSSTASICRTPRHGRFF